MYYPPMTNLPVENSAANDPCPRRGAMKQVDGEYRAKLIILAEEDRLTAETSGHCWLTTRHGLNSANSGSPAYSHLLVVRDVLQQSVHHPTFHH